jgi:hypothetical protein
LFVVPVRLAEEHGGEAGCVKGAAFEEDRGYGVVVAFGDVVRGLLVVGVGASLEEEAGEFGVVGDAGGAVDGALKGGTWVGVVDHLVPAGVGAGAGVEEGLGGEDEGCRAGFVEAEIAGEAEVGKGVPLVGASFCCGGAGIAGEEGADGGFVGEDGCSVDAGGGDLRVASEDEVGVLEGAGAVAGMAGDAGYFDEGGDGIGEGGYGADEVEGLDVCGELWPTFEAVFAGDDELGVGEADVGGLEVGGLQVVEAGMVAGDAGERFGDGEGAVSGEIFGLFFVLVEVRASG